MHHYNLPPLIILDDYSVNQTLQDAPIQDSKKSALAESPSLATLSPHYHNHSATSNSDSDIPNPPSSGIPSEPNSAATSEFDLPSAVASDSDLLLPPKIKSFGPPKQTGIHQFFKVLTEDEIQAVKAKRKRIDSEEEDADWVGWRKKEEDQRQRKLVFRRNKNHIAQQKHRDKLVKINIEIGMWNANGKSIQVSWSTSCTHHILAVWPSSRLKANLIKRSKPQAVLMLLLPYA